MNRGKKNWHKKERNNTSANLMNPSRNTMEELPEDQICLIRGNQFSKLQHIQSFSFIIYYENNAKTMNTNHTNLK